MSINLPVFWFVFYSLSLLSIGGSLGVLIISALTVAKEADIRNDQLLAEMKGAKT